MITGHQIAEGRKRLGLSQSEFAERLGVSRNAVYLWEADRGRPTGRRKKALTQLLSAHANMVAPSYSSGDDRPFMLGGGQVPVYRAVCSTARAPWSFKLCEIVDMVTLPPRLANRKDLRLFAVPVDTMVPRYRPGEMVMIGNARAASDGDDVVIMRKVAEGAEPDVAIGRLVKATDGYVEIEQYNPAKSVRIPRKDVGELWRVIPLTELF